MPTQIDRCSFEVVYKKNAEGIEVIENVVVRTGVSDASVTLTISQVYNLARLLGVVHADADRNGSDRHIAALQQALPRTTTIRSD
jgi:hypothetical protein